jgi:hypothetical protein
MPDMPSGSLSKCINLYIPFSKELPSEINNLTTDEIYEMIMIGFRSITNGKKFVCDTSYNNAITNMRDIFESDKSIEISTIKSDFSGKINVLNNELDKTTKLYDIFKSSCAIEKDRYMSSMNSINTEKINFMTTNFDKSLSVRDTEIKVLGQSLLDKEREIIRLTEHTHMHERNMSSIIAQKVDDQLRANASSTLISDNLSMTSIIDSLKDSRDIFVTANMRHTNSVLGRIGEQKLEELCHQSFRDFIGFSILDVHSFGGYGDYHLKFSEFTVLADSKLYSGSVGVTNRDKIRDDLMKHDHINFAWLVSMETTIDKFDKAPFMFEWVSHNKCICYINSLLKGSSPVDTLRCVWYMCKLLYNMMGDLESGSGIDTDTETGTETGLVSTSVDRCEFLKLREYKVSVCDKLSQYRGFIKERDDSLKSLTGVLQNQDNIVRELLNTETNNFVINDFNIIMEWWNKCICVNEGCVLKSSLLWTRFKNDTGNNSNITPYEFRLVLKSFILPSNMSSPKTKNSAFDLYNIDWKNNGIINDNINGNINGMTNGKDIIPFSEKIDINLKIGI